jgi:ATP-binding cassette subfamily F protein 3
MLSPPIIAVDNVSVGYDPKNRCCRVTLRIDTDDRIALRLQRQRQVDAAEASTTAGAVFLRSRADKLSAISRSIRSTSSPDGSAYEHAQVDAGCHETKVRGRTGAIGSREGR